MRQWCRERKACEIALLVSELHKKKSLFERVKKKAVNVCTVFHKFGQQYISEV